MAKKKDTKKINISTYLSEDKKRVIFIAVAGVLVIVSLLLIISGAFGNFEKVKLRTNNKAIFTIADLSVNDIKFRATSEEVKAAFGKATKEETIIKNQYEYLILTYPGLKLTLREYYDDYILVKAEITSNKYTAARKIKVGNRIMSAIKKYNVSISDSNYIYKNYNMDALSQNLIKDNVYFAIRNKKEVEYVNRDAVVEGQKSNTAILKFDYKNGKISKITWSYDVE